MFKEKVRILSIEPITGGVSVKVCFMPNEWFKEEPNQEFMFTPQQIEEACQEIFSKKKSNATEIIFLKEPKENIRLTQDIKKIYKDRNAVLTTLNSGEHFFMRRGKLPKKIEARRFIECFNRFKDLADVEPIHNIIGTEATNVIIVSRRVSKEEIKLLYAIALAQKGFIEREDVLPYFYKCFPDIKDIEVFYVTLDHYCYFLHPYTLKKFIYKIAKTQDKKDLITLTEDGLNKAYQKNKGLPTNHGRIKGISGIAKELKVSRITLWLKSKKGLLDLEKQGKYKTITATEKNILTLKELKNKKDKAKRIKSILDEYSKKRNVSISSAHRWFYRQKSKGLTLDEIEDKLNSINP
jgi:hypothetical protein